MNLEPWAKYLAQDRDGELWQFSAKPVKSLGHAVWAGEFIYKEVGMLLLEGRSNPNWKNTLIEIGVDHYRLMNDHLIKLDPIKKPKTLREDIEETAREKVFYESQQYRDKIIDNLINKENDNG